MSDPLALRFARELPAGSVLFREGDSGVALDFARLLEFMEFLETPRKLEG